MMNDKDKQECVDVIDSFLGGNCSESVWDDFISEESKDPVIQIIKDYCAETAFIYPAEDQHQWCSKEGKVKLLLLSGLIENWKEADIRRFIEEEVKSYNKRIK